MSARTLASQSVLSARASSARQNQRRRFCCTTPVDRVHLFCCLSSFAALFAFAAVAQPALAIHEFEALKICQVYECKYRLCVCAACCQRVLFILQTTRRCAAEYCRSVLGEKEQMKLLPLCWRFSLYHQTNDFPAIMLVLMLMLLMRRQKRVLCSASRVVYYLRDETSQQ